MQRRIAIQVYCLLAAAALAVVPARALEGEATVTISKADCAQLVEHVPAPDVAYQPGVDAYGREVVPAELNGGAQIQVPETLRIPIEIDLLKRLGIPVTPGLYESDIPIGEVIYRNGRFTFNGQALQDEAAAELARRCRKTLRDQPG